MHRLRYARLFIHPWSRPLGRLVLAWFVLSLAVAIASPLVHPKDIQLVCSASGTLKFLDGNVQGKAGSAAALDCPLCAGVAAPPRCRC